MELKTTDNYVSPEVQIFIVNVSSVICESEEDGEGGSIEGYPYGGEV